MLKIPMVSCPHLPFSSAASGPGVPIPTRGEGAPAPGDHRGLGACPPIKHGGFNGKYHYKWRCIAGEIVKLNGECSIATFDREGG